HRGCRGVGAGGRGGGGGAGGGMVWVPPPSRGRRVPPGGWPPMAFETLTLEREEGFAVVTLNRPPANAISEQLVRDLAAALTAVETDDAVRALILTGAGDRIFCAGADLGSAFSGR